MCGDDSCPLCKTEAKGNCQSESVVYKIWCQKCEEGGNSAVIQLRGKNRKNDNFIFDKIKTTVTKVTIFVPETIVPFSTIPLLI